LENYIGQSSKCVNAVKSKVHCAGVRSSCVLGGLILAVKVKICAKYQISSNLETKISTGK